MNVIKAIFGGLIGAGIGVAAQYALNTWYGQTYVWFPVVIGVLTGIVARMFAGTYTSNGSRFLSGAFAGLIAGLAILGIEFGPTLFGKEPEFGPLRTESVATAGDNQDDADSGSEGTDEAEEDNSEESETGSADSEQTEGGDEDSAGSDADESEADTDEEGSSADEESDNESAEESASGSTSSEPTVRNPGDRSRGVAAPNPATVEERNKLYSELIKKEKPWLDFLLPYIFLGVGMLLAYQLARGFGSTNPKR